MYEHLTDSYLQLEQLTALVVQGLKPKDHKKVVSLITQEVH